MRDRDGWQSVGKCGETGTVVMTNSRRAAAIVIRIRGREFADKANAPKRVSLPSSLPHDFLTVTSGNQYILIR